MTAVEAKEKVGGGTHQLEGPSDALSAISSAVSTTSLRSAEERKSAPSISLTCADCAHNLGKPVENIPLHQCPNCNSQTFRFRITPESNRHWLRIKEQLAKTAPELREPQPASAEPAQPIARTRWPALIAALLLGTIAFFLLRHWLYGAPIPFIHKPQQYEFTLPANPENAETTP
ncbi:MAG TPA: hypothetical protein VF773_21350 [Verrucomicrobiae bacterium]